MAAKKQAPIKINPNNAGKLRAKLGVPAGKNIPVAKLEQAAKSKNPTTRKQANFALNARKFNHPKGK